MKIKETVLKGITKSAEKAVNEVSGEKCLFFFHEPKMPEALKKAKFQDK